MRTPTSLLFDLAAGFYGWFTAQEAWRSHCRKLVDVVPHGERLTIVDLGCGPGVSAFEIARVRPKDAVIGLDFARGMLREAKSRERSSGLPPGRVGWLQGDAGRLPFPDRSIDVLTGHSFLYLLPDREKVLAECLRVLRPGGFLILMEPNRTPSFRGALGWSLDPRHLLAMTLWRPFSRFYGRFTKDSLSGTLQAAGFESASVEETLSGLGLLARAERPREEQRLDDRSARGERIRKDRGSSLDSPGLLP